jgi:hypothetical protein
VTDLLAERFAALTGPAAEADWLDVRRRARPARTPAAIALAAVFCAGVAAATVAAANGWLFASHARQVTAVTHVTFRGEEWRVSITTGGRLRVCVRLSRPGRLTMAAGCGTSPPRPIVLPLGARHVDVDGGQIWVGSTLGFTRRIAITDTAGRVHTTRPVAAPRGAKTPFRFWVVPIDSGKATSIAVSDRRGRTLRFGVR